MYINCRINCTSTGGGEGEKQGRITGFALQLIFTFLLALHLLCDVCVFVSVYQLHPSVFLLTFVCCVEIVSTLSESVFTLCFITPV